MDTPAKKVRKGQLVGGRLVKDVVSFFQYRDITFEDGTVVRVPEDQELDVIDPELQDNLRQAFGRLGDV